MNHRAKNRSFQASFSKHGAFWLCCALAYSCSSKSNNTSPSGSAGTGAGGSTDTSMAGTDAGVAGSAPMLPPSTVTIMSRFPAAAASVCADAPLRLSFSAPVTVGTAGKVQVFKTSAPDTAVASIDIAAATYRNTLEARPFYNVRPIFLEGNDAVIYLPNGSMSAADSYFVTIDAGVFVDATKNPLPAITGPSDWQFSTVAPAPADPTLLTVQREGAGDFCTVQGAVDFLPAANMTPTTISIKNGTYHEIVYIPAKHNITFQGEDRKQTIIAYPNNNTLQTNAGTALGTSFRAMIEAEASNGLTFENMTLKNTTPQGGSQAEALRIEPGDMSIVRDMDILSTQDTVLLSGRAFVTNSYIEGNVDYFWGKGTAYIEKSEIKTVWRAGYLVQARNGLNYGYVFVDDTFTTDGKANGTYLGRIEADRFPLSNVAYVNCKFDSFLNPKGWLLTNSTGAAVSTLDLTGLKFWEYQSTDMSGTPLDVSMRDPASLQITADQATMLRDKATVLAGWDPTAGGTGGTGGAAGAAGAPAN